MYTSSNRKQSKRVREFIAKKNLEKEQEEKELESKKQNFISVFQNPTTIGQENATNQMTLKVFYDVIIKDYAPLISSGNPKDILRAITILKRLLADGHDIDYIIIRLLCHGSLIFFQFLKQVRRDLLNHFEAYDEIVHACKPSEIIELLKFGVLELEHATKINKMESLEASIYMFIQLTDYEDTIQDYLWQTYSTLVSKQGLLRNMLLRNVPHEIAVYLKSLDETEFNERLVKFTKVLKSYENMEEKYKGSPMLKGRLINLIRMIMDMVLNQDLKLPQMKEFMEYFKDIYVMKNYDEVPLFLEQLPWDAYWYISMEIYQKDMIRKFPYDTPDGKWV
jgi:hypothetical protein